jgi:hypothetical protein
MIEGSMQEITSRKGQVCREILDDLPEWFGISESADAHVREAEQLPMYAFMSQRIPSHFSPSSSIIPSSLKPMCSALSAPGTDKGLASGCLPGSNRALDGRGWPT